MGDTERGQSRASSRVAELEGKIQQATALIGELRETNYNLSGELAALRRELESQPAESTGAAGDEAPESSPPHAVAPVESEIASELAALRRERQTIRAKVVQLLERIEKLES